MEYQKYSENMKKLQREILWFLDRYENVEENYQNLINLINNTMIRTNRFEFESFLNLILNISNNHHRSPNFFDKIGEIIQYVKKDIVTFYSNYEIFNLFLSNKRLILILIQNEILKIDEQIINEMKTYGFKNIKYLSYFLPETKGENSIKKIENYEQNRLDGENDEYICKLIREDLIEEFIIYKTRNDMSLNSTIKLSTYETNSFLINQQIIYEISLIEYAAFFGSTQIFRYLYKNEVQLKPSLWLFSIHSDNPEMIHLLEENDVKPEDQTYEKCLKEAIKCHHNEIANYIIENYIKDENVKSKTEDDFGHNIYAYAIHYYNFSYFPEEFNHKFTIFYIIKYHNLEFVKFLFKCIEVNACAMIILNQSTF